MEDPSIQREWSQDGPVNDFNRFSFNNFFHVVAAENPFYPGYQDG